ncbi:MAG: hypothetical protein ACR2HG_08380 [Pyrinomonadaceae bacterium]
MNRFRGLFSIGLMIGLMIFAADAQGIRNERNVRDILRSLHSKADDFRYSLNNELDKNSVSRRDEDEIADDFRRFEDSLNRFDDKFQKRRENADDVTNLLSAAKTVNDFFKARQFGAMPQRDWKDVRVLLDRLASNYQIAWSWDNQNQQDPNYFPQAQPNYPTAPRSNNSAYNNALTGTYKLDATRSENTSEIADRAVKDANIQNNANAQSDLENKLQAPDQVIIDLRGNQVTLSSSNAAPITFTADGRDTTETTSNGKTLRVRSTLSGQELTVSSLGGDTDYTVVFASIENGKALRVTRRITTDYLNQTVFAESVYQKTDANAQLDNNPNSADDNGNYSSNDSQNNRGGNYPTTTTGRTGNFIVPNGTILNGLLEKDIDTKLSQNNDRFTLNVQSPNEYRGAIIEGHISGVNRSGKVTGRSQITFNFERIRLANGQTYEFAGYLQGITDETGKAVKIDTEGTAQGDSQTKETVKRGGIGAGIGAIIGAIAGGGKGAAIGAILGGGAGAGSVIVQGKDDLQLKAGSSITVQSSSPSR